MHSLIDTIPLTKSRFRNAVPLSGQTVLLLPIKSLTLLVKSCVTMSLVQDGQV